jgi:formylglycine-generating enzyme required for sulfatase activity
MPHVQIRNMPVEMHRTFKARAAAEGMSLSEYLLKELRPIASLPTMAEWVAEVRKGPLYDLDVDTAEVIRQAREENDRKWSSQTRRRSSTR